MSSSILCDGSFGISSLGQFEWSSREDHCLVKASAVVNVLPFLKGEMKVSSNIVSNYIYVYIRLIVQGILSFKE